MAIEIIGLLKDNLSLFAMEPNPICLVVRHSTVSFRWGLTYLFTKQAAF